MPPAVAAPSSKQSAQSTNLMYRQLCLKKGLKMRQKIWSGTVNPVSNNFINNIYLRTVGIATRLIVEISGTLTNNGTNAVSLTDFGLANLISNIQFYDLQNNQRTNTDGKHLTLISYMKRQKPFGGTADYNSYNSTTAASSQMFNVAPATWGVFKAPQTAIASAAIPFQAFFEIPIAYSNHDLRGGIFMNVVNTTANLQLTLNTNAFTAGTDTTNAVYSGNTGVFTSATVTIYEEYIDQLPLVNGQYAVPQQDLSVIYELKTTPFTGIVAGSDFPIPFNNFRSYQSLFTVFNNNPASSSGRAYGTDINYIARQTANLTMIEQIDPLYKTLLSREVIASDLPAGTYYHSFREQPIWTTQSGNQQMIINANTAAATAYITAYWEDFNYQGTLQNGSSLAAS